MVSVHTSGKNMVSAALSHFEEDCGKLMVAEAADLWSKSQMGVLRRSDLQ
jgi:hypothetical protein